MSSDTRPSAKIYRFPRKQAPHANPASRGTTIDRSGLTPQVEIAGWYHEAAVEAERQRKS